MTSQTGMRCTQPGWIEVCKPDGRRGLWVRTSAGSVELCAGREGDDAYVQMRPGRDLEDVGDLRAVVDYIVWAHTLASLADEDKG